MNNKQHNNIAKVFQALVPVESMSAFHSSNFYYIIILLLVTVVLFVYPLTP